MAGPRGSIVIAAGVICLLSAPLLILVAMLMHALETPLTTCLMIGLSSASPMLVVVAWKGRWPGTAGDAPAGQSTSQP
jgi:hypothetical protein